MIRIVTDSASDITREQAKKHDIEILPVLITYDDKTIKEFYDITPCEYHNILLECDDIPKTAQITLDSFLSCFQKAHADGVTNLLYIALNSKGSGTYNTALIARDMFYEENGTNLEIEILDSLSYSFIYGSVVIECAKMRDENVEFADIVEHARKRLATGEALLAIFELKFLKKSGRIPGGAAFIGEAMGLKPIALVADGAVNVCQKARGEVNACKKLIDLVCEKVKNPEEQTAYVVHGICEAAHLDFIKNELLNTVKFKNVEFLHLGASITTNAGPKSVAVFYHK